MKLTSIFVAIIMLGSGCGTNRTSHVGSTDARLSGGFGPVSTFFRDLSFINSNAPCHVLGIPSTSIVLIADAKHIKLMSRSDDTVYLGFNIPKDGRYVGAGPAFNTFKSANGKTTLQTTIDSRTLLTTLKVSTAKGTCVFVDGSGA